MTTLAKRRAFGLPKCTENLGMKMFIGNKWLIDNNILSTFTYFFVQHSPCALNKLDWVLTRMIPTCPVMTSIAFNSKDGDAN